MNKTKIVSTYFLANIAKIKVDEISSNRYRDIAVAKIMTSRTVMLVECYTHKPYTEFV